MSLFPEHIIEQINDIPIDHVLEQEGIQLVKKGASYQCCCPLHKEKTPSFHVRLDRNTFKCFGCGEGGTGITFIMKYRGMTFREAVEHLAGKNGIQLERRELTPQEKEAQFRRDKLFQINREAVAYFRKCLKDSEQARKYCEKRGWGEDVMESFQVGYAPKTGGLLAYMTAKKWKEEDLISAGLIKENEENGSRYDTFRSRIMFPIFDTSGNPCGFTGRYIEQKPDIPKYLNTGDTEIFNKKRFLFGYFQGFRKIREESTAFLVEGNPDVLRLHQIEKVNTVATCGTELTDECIKLLQRNTRTVVIIPDNDEPGQKSLVRSAEKLIQAGFNVRIMRIPTSKKNPCKDADEYFQLKPKDFNEVYSKACDFIPWYAESKLENVNTQSEVSQVVAELAKILASYQNESVVKMYLDEFCKLKKYKAGTLWRVEYNKAKAELERKSLQEEGASDMATRYGFYYKNNCYFAAADKNGGKRWSNFILVPILHIRDEKNARRIFNMINFQGQECVVKFNQSELISLTDFKTRTESAGNYVWEAGLPELTTLKKHLYNDTPSADEIRQLGWQKRYNFYAWGNGGLADGRFEAVDKFGIVTINGQKYYIPGNALDTRDNTQGYQLMRKFVFTKTNDITLREIVSKLIVVFGDNAKVGFCFLLATLFRDIITSVTTSFPILNLFGPKGTGKTQLGHALTSFFIPDYIAPNINNTTKAALAEAVAEVSNALVHIDEYKNNLDLEKREFLKGLWDGAGRSRMNLDNDKRRETTAVDCGVILSGQEMPTADIALFNRLIFLTFTKPHFSDEEKRNFENLQLIEKRGLTHLTAEILEHRPRFQSKFRTTWDDTLSDLNDKVRDANIEDRTLRNWAVILAAFRCLCPYLDLPMRYDEMLNLCASMCIEQNSKTVQNNELSNFWNTLEVLVTSRVVWMDVDYKISCGKGNEVRIIENNSTATLQAGKNYLFMSYNRIAQLYRKAARESDMKSITPESLKFYLEHSPEFMGTIRSARFKVPDTPQGYSAVGSNKSKVTTAMIFDYEQLQKNYNIDICIVSDSEYGGDATDELPEANPPMPELDFSEEN